MIRLKIVLRNVIGKPLRTAIIILSLAAAAFTALFCISGINTAQNGLRDYFRANFGEADIMIYSYSSTVKVEPSAFPQNTRILEQTIAGITMTTPNPDYLNYVKKVNIGIVGMDTQSAYEMKLLDIYPLPIGEIAAMSGFNSTIYFYNQFRRFYKMTPRQYRERHFQD